MFDVCFAVCGRESDESGCLPLDDDSEFPAIGVSA